jgi:hypothetical protein
MEPIKFLIYLVIFTGAIVVNFAIPGFVINSLLKIKLTKLENIVLSIVLGISTITSLNFFFRLIKLDLIANLLPIFFVFFFLIILKKKKRILKVNNLHTFIIPLFVIFIGVLAQTQVIMHGVSLESSSEIRLNSAPDIMWNMALIRETAKNIPPIHPGYAPEIVQNYHYFTQLFMGIILKTTNIPIVELYHFMFPLFFSSLLGLTSLILIKKLSKSVLIHIFFILMTYFASSFSYLLPLWLGKNFNWGESSFWVSQIFSMLNNPPLSLSVSIFTIILFCLNKYWMEKENKFLLPLGILCGTLIAFKVYAGLIILISLGGIAMIDLLRKDKNTLKLFLLSLLIGFIVFIPIGKASPSYLVYAPFWFLHTMVENPDRLNIGIWALKEQTYWANNNIFAVTRLRILELIIFISGNLGIRIIGLLIIPLFFIQKISRQKFNFFLLLSISIGIIIPLFFIQKEGIGNTIQFFYYSLIIGNILTAIVIQKLLINKKRLLILVSILIIILAIPTSVKVFYENQIHGNNLIILKEEKEALNFLKENTKSDSIILLPMNVNNQYNLYVSALSERNTYLSDRFMVKSTSKDFETREKDLDSFFNTLNKEEGYRIQEKFTNKYKIDYIYLTGEDKILLNNIFIPNNLIFNNNYSSIIKL